MLSYVSKNVQSLGKVSFSGEGKVLLLLLLLSIIPIYKKNPGHYNKTNQINLAHFLPSRRQKALALSYDRAYKRWSAILR